jgi:molecular chaperone GrpE
MNSEPKADEPTNSSPTPGPAVGPLSAAAARTAAARSAAVQAAAQAAAEIADANPLPPAAGSAHANAASGAGPGAGMSGGATSYVDPSIALEASVTQLENKNVTLEATVRDLTDRLLRTHAEMDNIRKRNEREKADMAKYAITKFAHDVVEVGDNFQRATAAVKPGADPETSLKGLLEGVELTERAFQAVLERHGVKSVNPLGEPFNPNFHQAVMEAQDLNVQAGTVLQVFSTGYVIEDRVLRPAMVVVAKGGFKPVKPVTDGKLAEAPEAKPAGDTADRPA